MARVLKWQFMAPHRVALQHIGGLVMPMTNPSAVLTAGMLVLGLIGIAALLLEDWIADRRASRVWRSVDCPALRMAARILAVRDFETGKFVDVARCSAVGAGRATPTCNKPCLREPAHASVAHAAIS